MCQVEQIFIGYKNITTLSGPDFWNTFDSTDNIRFKDFDIRIVETIHSLRLVMGLYDLLNSFNRVCVSIRHIYAHDKWIWIIN